MGFWGVRIELNFHHTVESKFIKPIMDVDEVSVLQSYMSQDYEMNSERQSGINQSNMEVESINEEKEDHFEVIINKDHHKTMLESELPQPIVKLDAKTFSSNISISNYNAV